MKLNFIKLSLFCLLYSVFGFAQELPLQFLDITNGLSNNSVITIHQDNNGFMWFGTYDGLNRYDGYNFKVYRNRIGDATSLVSNSVYCIQADSKNNIWVGGSKGACVLDQSKGYFVSLSFTIKTGNKPLKDIIHQIKLIKPGLMLAGSQESGLVMFENEAYTGKQVPLENGGKIIKNYDVLAIEPTASGKFCWVFIRDAGLCRFDFDTKKLTLAFASGLKINCLKATGGNNLWLGSDEGLFLFSPASFSLSANYMSGKISVASLLTEDKNLWIATDGGGIHVLHENAKKAIPYRELSNTRIVKSNSVWSLYRDNKGNKWMGTLRGGISKLGSAPISFKHIKYPATDPGNLTENFILSFCEDQDNNLWIGTDGAGLRYWNRKTNTYLNYNNAGAGKYTLTSNFITSIIKDNVNRIWLSTWHGGVNRINPQTGQIEYFSCYNPTTKQVEKNVWLVYQDSKQNIWASATNEGCLYLFNSKANAFELFDASVKNLQCLTETRDGMLWGGNYTSLIVIDPKLKTHKSFDVGSPIRTVLEDKNNNLWVGTQEGGLLKFDRKTQKFTGFTTDNGLPGNTILRLIEDKDGNLWMSTYNGLARFNPVTKAVRNFSVSDGLQGNQFSFNAGTALSSGEFVFGGINGFNIFDPEDVKAPVQNIPVLLTGLQVNNKPVEKNAAYIKEQRGGQIKDIQLPFDQTTLSIEFVALDYNNADKNTYSYLLGGWDDHWNFTDNIRKANYAHLHEGSYVFKVRTKNLNGGWNKAVTLLHVTVLPPWYRSWWAYCLYTISIGAVIFAYIRYNRYKERMRYEVRIQQMERKKEKELSEKQLSMFTYISHEFRTPLSLIIDPLKKALRNDSGLTTAPDNDLAVAHRNARRLLSLVDQLLLFRKAESDADALKLSAINLNNLCNEVYQCFVNQAREKNISYQLEAPETGIEIIGDYEKIEIALFNLMSNAFKHTPSGGSISMIIIATNDDATITIKDTGSGIAPADLPFIFEKFRQAKSATSGSGFGIGLYIVKYFIEKHKGSITCTSTQGQGSAFTLQLCRGHEHFSEMPIDVINPKMSGLVEELLEDDMPETTPEILPETTLQDIDPAILSEKKTLLIVDDNADIRNYLSKLFAPFYLIHCAENGLEGFKLAQKHLPDLILSDISMEVMDGLELCKKIKESEELNHIPVILLTATTNSEVHLQGINEGADDYITKPFDSDILKAKVERLIKSRNDLRKYFLDSITLKENTLKVPEEYQQFLKKCIEVIEANLDDNSFSIKSFSQLMGMSHRTLYSKIKLISGQTLNAFIRSVRLRRAALLMLTENINITQASTRVGFDDPKYFRQQFVKLFGITPSEYIKKYKSTFNQDLKIVKK